MTLMSLKAAEAVRKNLAAIDPAPILAQMAEIDRERDEIANARRAAAEHVETLRERLRAVPASSGALALALRRGQVHDSRGEQALRDELQQYQGAMIALDKDGVRLEVRAEEVRQRLRHPARHALMPAVEELRAHAVAIIGELHELYAAVAGLHEPVGTIDALAIKNTLANMIAGSRQGSWGVAPLQPERLPVPVQVVEVVEAVAAHCEALGVRPVREVRRP